MRVIDRRIDMELISRQALAAFMKAKSPTPGKSISYSALAEAATNQLRLAGVKGKKVSKSTIGHLVTGHIKSTDSDAAKAIAAALGVPWDALFVQRVSIVTRDVLKGRAA